MAEHPRTAAVAAALRAGGATGEPRTLPESTKTAPEAAAALGCEVGAIANSLVFECDGSPLLVMTSGAHRVDTRALAERLGRGPIRRASPDFVLAATGQPIGGVSPLAHPAPLETIVDPDLAAFDVIWAAAGTADSVFPTSFGELVRLTGGRVVAVA